MSFFSKNKNKGKEESEAAASGPRSIPAASLPKSMSSPDIAGSPKGGDSHHSKSSSKPAPAPNMQISKAEDDEQEDERLEERKRLWTKVSGLVGKDIASLLSLPVSFFEPISVLQSMAEPMRNVEILNKACSYDDPIERMCRIAAFCVSLFSYYVRTAKPFNPVLGETYEFEPTSKEYKTICEQVSHHPPVGICYTTSKDWTLCQESRIETKFWGTSVDVNSVGNNVLNISKYNEEIRWKNPTAVIHNIILGRLWIEYHGSLPINNITTGHSANLSFKKYSMFSSSSFAVNGEVKDASGKVRAIISGNWKEHPHVSMCRVDEHGKKGEIVELWRRVVSPAEKSHKWRWDPFIHELTALTPEQEQYLPPTDSRLRGDLRALGALDNKLAGKEKMRIEEKERQKRKQREAEGKKWSPVYFNKIPDDKFEYRWSYAGNYWEEREERKEKAANGELVANGLNTIPEEEDASEQPGKENDNDNDTEEDNAQKLDTSQNGASAEVVA